jgi:hypothetical protein
MTEEQRRLLTEMVTTLSDLAEYTRREHQQALAARRPELAALLEQILAELEPAARDMATLDAVRVAVERHGGGPYPIEDLAAIAGVPEPDARRIVAQLVRDGMATPDQDPGEPG